MSVSADGYTASADDYTTSTNLHSDPSSRDDYDYYSGADGNSNGHCDPANTDDDGDSMDNSNSRAGF